LTEQKRWATATIAFDEWRSALERAGHLVFLFSLGKDSCRGFSLWDDFAPVVAVNTAWNEPARIFTLFHEMGHLITRTSSACVESVRTSSKTDPVERWCERFAAHVLMPTRDLEAALQRYGWSANAHITDLSVASRVASRYKVSLRAAVIRLIELRAATWSLYDAIPPISDDKRNGGGGGGRNRTQIREDQFGERATSILVNAVERELLDRSQAVEFLDIPDVTFDALAQAGRAGR
jgi:Zn-dependent peptidase ImmA (M78 family)